MKLNRENKEKIFYIQKLLLDIVLIAVPYREGTEVLQRHA